MTQQTEQTDGGKELPKWLIKEEGREENFQKKKEREEQEMEKVRQMISEVREEMRRVNFQIEKEREKQENENEKAKQMILEVKINALESWKKDTEGAATEELERKRNLKVLNKLRVR